VGRAEEKIEKGLGEGGRGVVEKAEELFEGSEKRS